MNTSDYTPFVSEYPYPKSPGVHTRFSPYSPRGHYDPPWEGEYIPAPRVYPQHHIPYGRGYPMQREERDFIDKPTDYHLSRERETSFPQKEKIVLSDVDPSDEPSQVGKSTTKDIVLSDPRSPLPSLEESEPIAVIKAPLIPSSSQILQASSVGSKIKILTEGPLDLSNPIPVIVNEDGKDHKMWLVAQIHHKDDEKMNSKLLELESGIREREIRFSGLEKEYERRLSQLDESNKINESRYALIEKLLNSHGSTSNSVEKRLLESSSIISSMEKHLRDDEEKIDSIGRYIKDVDGNLRREISDLDGRTKRGMGDLDGKLRREIGDLDGKLRREIEMVVDNPKIGDNMSQLIDMRSRELIKYIMRSCERRDVGMWRKVLYKIGDPEDTEDILDEGYDEHREDNIEESHEPPEILKYLGSSITIEAPHPQEIKKFVSTALGKFGDKNLGETLQQGYNGVMGLLGENRDNPIGAFISGGYNSLVTSLGDRRDQTVKKFISDGAEALITSSRGEVLPLPGSGVEIIDETPIPSKKVEYVDSMENLSLLLESR